jgi:hypothetical protein
MRWNRVVAITGDCKSPAFRLRRFESYFQHQIKIPRSVGFLFFTLLFAVEQRALADPAE